MKKATIVALLLFAVLANINTTDGVSFTNPNIKTVEFFIGQATNQPAAGSTTSFKFDFYIPESNPAKRYSWIEIELLDSNAAALTATVTFNGGGDKEVYSVVAGGAETVWGAIRYPFYPAITNGTNGPYTLSITNGGAVISALSAKLVLTYEHDLSAPRQLKTVKYFAHSENNSLATTVRTAGSFDLTVPESGTINVRSAFLIFRGVSAGGVDNSLAINTTNAATATVALDSSGITQAFMLLYNATELYGITSSGTNAYTVNAQGTGVVTSLWSAEAVLTYEYDGSAPSQQRTVRYLLASNNNSLAANTNSANGFLAPIAEAGIRIYSAWIKLTGYAALTDPIVTVNTTDGRQIASKIDQTVEMSNFVILHNATELYSMTGNTTNGPYTLNFKSTTVTNMIMGELFVTYNYSNASSTQMKTVEYPIVTDDLQRTANVDYDNLFFIITPENNVSAKSLYMESTATTGAIAAHNIFVTFEGGNRTYVPATSGEQTFDYLLHNLSNSVTNAANWYANLSTGVNGMLTMSRQDSAIESLASAKVIATYFFRP